MAEATTRCAGMRWRGGVGARQVVTVLAAVLDDGLEAVEGACTEALASGACSADVVELVNHLEAEARAGRQGRTAEQLARRDLIVLDELGYLPFAHNGGDA